MGIETAIIAASAISAGSSLLGGAMSSKAAGRAADVQSQSAERAAQIQAAAANRAADLQQQQYYQTRADMTPWRTVGVNALNQLASEFGVAASPATTQQAALPPPSPAAAPPTAGQGFAPGTISTAPQQGYLSPQMQNFANSAIPGTIRDAYAPKGMAAGPGRARADRRGNMRGDEMEFAGPTPYTLPTPMTQPGSRYNEATAPQAAYTPPQTVLPPQVTPPPQAGGQASGTTATTPDRSNFYKSPGYQFRLSEGINAMEKSAAAKGLLQSGFAMRGIGAMAQGQASSEYNTYANRLAAMAGVGQTTTAQLGQFGAQSATAQGAALQSAGAASASGYLGAGQAQASGYLNQANAWNQALGGVGQAVGWGLGAYSNLPPQPTSGWV